MPIADKREVGLPIVDKRGFIQSRALKFVAKTLKFLKNMLCPYGQGEEVEAVREGGKGQFLRTSFTDTGRYLGNFNPSTV